MPEQKIVLLTGERQVGKSTLCRKLVARFQKHGYRVSGLLTRRTGSHDLEVTEIHTGHAYSLTLPFEPQTDRLLGNFIFSSEAVERSKGALKTGFPAQIFMLDELGPLELKHHEGWVDVIQLLAEQIYGLAFIVVRPELIGQAIGAFPATVYTVVWVREENRNRLVDTLFHMVSEMDANDRAVER